jgi:hypothetical protein
MSISSNVDASLSFGSFEANLFARSDFGHTLSLPTSGPVLTLPPGFTAYSDSGAIVNNLFIPEPGSLTLFGLGSVVFTISGRRGYRSETLHKRDKVLKKGPFPLDKETSARDDQL